MGPLKMTKLLVSAALVITVSSMAIGKAAVPEQDTVTTRSVTLQSEPDGLTWRGAVELIVALVRELRLRDAGRDSFVRAA